MIDLNEAGRELRENPLAEPASIGELRRRANGLQRRRMVLTRLVPALVVLALVAGAAGALRLGASHGQRVTARPPEGGTPVTLPDVHPAPGSSPLDYGDARVWVPQSWKVVAPGATDCSGELDKMVLLGNAQIGGPSCPAGSNASPRIGALVAIGPIGHTGYSSTATTMINGVRADQLPSGSGRFPGEDGYEVPALGVSVGVVGTDGRAILDTLGPSARDAVLSPRPTTSVPTGWQTLRYQGVQAAVPAAWPVQNLSATAPQPGCGGTPFRAPAVAIGTVEPRPGCYAELTYPLPADGLWLYRQLVIVDRLPPYGRLVHDGPVKAYLSIGDDPASQPGPMPPFATLVLIGPGNTAAEMEVGFGADPTIAEHIIDSITADGPGQPAPDPTTSTAILVNCGPAEVAATGNAQGATGVAIVEVNVTNIGREPCQVPAGWSITISVGDHPVTSGSNSTPSALAPGQTLNSRWEWSNYCGAAGPISVTLQLGPKVTDPVASSAEGFARLPRCDNGPGAPSLVSIIQP